MAQVIIYEIEDNGVVAIVRPTSEVLATRTVMQIAVKDVPAGRPFKIIDESELPTNRTLRDAWRWQEDLSVEANRDGVGGASYEFEE